MSPSAACLRRRQFRVPAEQLLRLPLDLAGGPLRQLLQGYELQQLRHEQGLDHLELLPQLQQRLGLVRLALSLPPHRLVLPLHGLQPLELERAKQQTMMILVMPATSMAMATMLISRQTQCRCLQPCGSTGTERRTSNRHSWRRRQRLRSRKQLLQGQVQADSASCCSAALQQAAAVRQSAAGVLQARSRCPQVPP